MIIPEAAMTNPVSSFPSEQQCSVEFWLILLSLHQTALQLHFIMHTGERHLAASRDMVQTDSVYRNPT